MTRGEKKLYLHLTEKCNLSCKHCYLGVSPQKAKSLSWPQIKNSLIFFYTKGYKTVEFTGGEPYFSPYLKKAVKLAQKTGYKNIGISTNGYSDKIIDLFTPQEISHFTFGLDGPTEKSNQYFRGKNHFNKCLDSIGKAKRKGFEVCVTQCIHAKNITKIKKTVFLLEQLGVSKLSINYTSAMGNAKESCSVLTSPRQWINLRKKILKSNCNKKIVLRLPYRFLETAEYIKLKKSGYSCPLGEPKQAIVFPNGKIFFCCLFTDNTNFSGGFVTAEKVTITRSDLTLLKKYPTSACPAQECLLEKPRSKKVVPICVYQKIIISPQKG